MTSLDTSPSATELDAIARRAKFRMLESVRHAKGGHVGGPFSAADILASLYFSVMNIRPDEPNWPDRDRFILSKGHSSIALYTMLAMRGYFSEDELSTFDSINSRLQGHPDMTITPGVDMSSGSLGLGFSGALGIALGAKAEGSDFTTYVMLGDGECNEGVVWEGAHVAARYNLDNIVAIVDHNRLQQFGWTGDEGVDRRPPYLDGQLADRWRSFGWEVLVTDGHDVPQLLETFAAAKLIVGKPVVVVAETIKGKGVSFMEGDFTWHSRVPNDAEFAQAAEELGQSLEGQK